MLTRRLFVGGVSAFSLSACVSLPTEAPRTIALGHGVGLTLPPLPGYPEQTRLSQLISTTVNGSTQHIQSALTLGPDLVTVVFSVPGGPPALSVQWSAQGIVERKESIVPPGLNGQRILADIFLSHWPTTKIQSQLSGGRLADFGAERRVTSADGRGVMTIQTIQSGERARLTLNNAAQGYSLVIISKPQVQ